MVCTMMPRKCFAAPRTAARYVAILGSLGVNDLPKWPAMRQESLLTIMCLAPKVLTLQRPWIRGSYSEVLFVVGKSRRAAGGILRPYRETRMATTPAPLAHQESSV